MMIYIIQSVQMNNRYGMYEISKLRNLATGQVVDSCAPFVGRSISLGCFQYHTDSWANLQHIFPIEFWGDSSANVILTRLKLIGKKTEELLEYGYNIYDVCIQANYSFAVNHGWAIKKDK